MKTLVCNVRKTTEAEYKNDAIRLFGVDTQAWRFVCPACGHVASVADYLEAGAPENAIGFSCVGRWLHESTGAFEQKRGPCNYAGGGLIKINPVEIEGRGHFFELDGYATLDQQTE